MPWSAVLLSALAVLTSAQTNSPTNNNLDDAQRFLSDYNARAQEVWNAYVVASWNYDTNLTDHNNGVLLEKSLALTEFEAEAYVNKTSFNTTGFPDDVIREFDFLGSAPQEGDTARRLQETLSEMGRIYAVGQVCDQDDPDNCRELEPGLTEIMATSRDYEERLWVWVGWRDAVSKAIRPHYVTYVDLKNQIARANGYTDYGDQWRWKYETDTFEQDMLDIWEEVKPFYLELHAYVRRKLYDVYGDKINLRGPLPEHLLGDMWGRFWTNLYSLTVPFPDKESLDVTPAMLEQNYTIMRMYEVSEEFFGSLGLLPLPSRFFERSMLQRPTDREVACHATAWDFYDGEDFRIRMCTKVDMEDLLTIHHEMGHTQYQMQYAYRPLVFRDGANDAFHEAVGEVLALSAATPQHLHAIGLLDTVPDDPDADINFLLLQGLNMIATLPFSLVQDLWRWRVFSGEIPENEWNKKYWEMKAEIVGVVPPVERGEDQLDITSIYHVANDFDMIRYYARTIIEFQFQKAMCDEAGITEPLYKCDIYNSHAAGTKLANMLRLGRSRPWPEAMEAMTGQRKMLANSWKAYFQPLYVWLQQKNRENGDVPGWDVNWRPDPSCYRRRHHRRHHRRHRRRHRLPRHPNRCHPNRKWIKRTGRKINRRNRRQMRRQP
ncbi:angiotensin-converting enzyme-like isoform X1 [Branchiostoma floridae x Branchiostoma belcheri]